MAPPRVEPSQVQQQQQIEALRRAEAGRAVVAATPAPPLPANRADPVIPGIPAGTLSAGVAGTVPNLPAPAAPGVGNDQAVSAIPDDRQMATFASNVYEPSAQPGVPGWDRLVPNDSGDALVRPDGSLPVNANGQPVTLSPSLVSNQDSGLGAAVYVNDAGGAVVAFAGTDFGAAPDVEADLQQGIGIDNVQFSQAAALGKSVEAQFGQGQVAFTGHSLGGALASYAAVSTENAAVTFNAAGLSDASLARAGLPPGARGMLEQNGQIRRYTVPGDQLTAAQQDWRATAGLPDAVGREFLLAPQSAGVEHSEFLASIDNSINSGVAPGYVAPYSNADPLDQAAFDAVSGLTQHIPAPVFEALGLGQFVADLYNAPATIDYELHGEDGIVNNTVQLVTSLKDGAVQAYESAVADIDYELHGEDGVVNNTVQLATSLKDGAVQAYESAVADVDYELHGEDGIVNNTREFFTGVGGFFGGLIPG